MPVSFHSHSFFFREIEKREMAAMVLDSSQLSLFSREHMSRFDVSKEYRAKIAHSVMKDANTNFAEKFPHLHAAGFKPRFISRFKIVLVDAGHCKQRRELKIVSGGVWYGCGEDPEKEAFVSQDLTRLLFDGKNNDAAAELSKMASRLL